jgi:TolA-binding protein
MRNVFLYILILAFTGCASASAPKTSVRSQTSFEPGVLPGTVADEEPETEESANDSIPSAQAAPADPVPAPESAPTAPVVPTPSTVNEAKSENYSVQDPIPQPSAVPQKTEVTSAAVDPIPVSEIETLREKVKTLEAHVAELESKRTQLEVVPTRPHPATRAGASPDSNGGFVNDLAVSLYRQGMILFLSKKYSDAISTFGQFIGENPDHVLAGSAQYYVGESYFRQGNFTLAAQELQKVLVSYDRSPHLSSALARLSQAQDKIQLTQESQKNRQLLSSLFPLSPALKLLDSPSGGVTTSKIGEVQSSRAVPEKGTE